MYRDKKNYVKDGLILWLDGIKNTRHGHDEASTVWEDLSGNNNDYQLTNVKINLNSIYYFGQKDSNAFNEDNVREIFGENFNDSRTIELVIERDNNNSGVVLIGGKNSSKAFGFHGISNIIVSCGDHFEKQFTINKIDGIHNYTVIYSDDVSLYQDTDEMISNGTQVWTYYDNNSYIATRGSLANPYKGNIMTIRIYNRVLTDKEIKQNYEVDKLRFNM